MALEKRRRIGRRDAAAVILHPDQPPPALARLYPDVSGARVQAVLDQFLDHR